MATNKTYPCLTAYEAAVLIPNGAMVPGSGFTPAGAPKSVPRALAKRARELHQAGAALQVKLLSGASTGAACDDELAAAQAVSWRAPYITSAPMRQLANTGKIEFVDMHLSTQADYVGRIPKNLPFVDAAPILCTGVTTYKRAERNQYAGGRVGGDLRCGRRVRPCCDSVCQGNGAACGGSGLGAGKGGIGTKARSRDCNRCQDTRSARRDSETNWRRAWSSVANFPDLSCSEDTSTLAVVCLALDQKRALEAFGATP